MTLIRKLFNTLKPNGPKFIWCLVGNIKETIEWGEQKVLRSGTKQFRPGAKVYCFPPAWGDGYEKIRVLGLPRKQKKMIFIIISSRYITNWRKQKVYNPFIIEKMLDHWGWGSEYWDEEKVDTLLNSIKANSEK